MVRRFLLTISSGVLTHAMHPPQAMHPPPLTARYSTRPPSVPTKSPGHADAFMGDAALKGLSATLRAAPALACCSRRLPGVVVVVVVTRVQPRMQNTQPSSTPT
jgi:hypothetical protein